MVVRTAARALEAGRLDGPITRALAAIWARRAARGLVRPAIVPPGVAAVCVGGATLGGSGKTQVAIACARALAAEGARVVLVGHAYRSARAMPCVVRGVHEGASLDGLVEEVGDEAVVCARALEADGVHVVVGPSRQRAIDHAMLLSPDVLVLDGPLRVRARGGARVLSLLAVDARRPWGSGRVVPAGDLRADRSALLGCADHVVPVDATPSAVRWTSGGERRREDIAALRGRRVGLFTAMARPDRLVAALAEAGVGVESVVSVPDHGPLTWTARRRLRRPEAGQLDAWLATEKCALHLRGVTLPRLGVLESHVVLPGAVSRALEAVARSRTTRGLAH